MSMSEYLVKQTEASERAEARDIEEHKVRLELMAKMMGQLTAGTQDSNP
jgi:hypothetical protein